MTKRLHAGTKIFFPNPYVLRLTYDSVGAHEFEWNQLMRRAYKVITGTWGHTSIEFETFQKSNKHNHPAPPGSGHFVGMSPTAVIGSLFESDWVSEPRAYVCFKHEMDALQFRLTIDTKAIRVNMWPSDRLFRIHEVVGDES